MVKKRLLNKFKEKTTESKEKLITKTEDKPLTEYKEILYSSNSKSKKEAYAFSDQRMWRDIQAIEKNVDNIHINLAKKPSSELERIVDRLIEKKKK